MAQHVELHLVGGGVAPGKLHAYELADYLIALEDAIAAYTIAHERDLSKESIRVGLTAIYEGSLVLRFELNFEEYTLAAFQAIAGAVERNWFADLPGAALAPLRDLLRFVRQRECTVEFRITGQSEPLAVLTPGTQIPAQPHLSGETVIYGEILRVGGSEPEIMVRTLQGATLTCAATTSLAQNAGKLLYQTVALRGQATWSGETLQIEEFRVSELLEFAYAPATETFAELAELVDASYFDSTNPDYFLKELRE